MSENPQAEAKLDAEHWASMLSEYMDNIVADIEENNLQSAIAAVVQVREIVPRLDKALEEADGIVDGES